MIALSSPFPNVLYMFPCRACSIEAQTEGILASEGVLDILYLSGPGHEWLPITYMYAQVDIRIK